MSPSGIRCNPFLQDGGAKRLDYVVASHRVYRFNPGGPRRRRRWFQNLLVFLAVVLVGFSVFITVYFGHLETVPCTKRKHFVLLSKSMDTKIAEAGFQMIKRTFNWKIQPATHLESVRVRLISEEIIDALQRGVKKQQVRTELKAQTSQIEGSKWEIIVVFDRAVVNALCLPGGKIVVFTGLLNYFKTDAEVATIIGHEVGQSVARHAAEKLPEKQWSAILPLILYELVKPVLVNLTSTILLCRMLNRLVMLPISQKMEIEAGYIGLQLMASAGSDPRVAPKAFEKLGKLNNDSILNDYLSTHPSGKKRAQLLAQAKLMDEALGFNREEKAHMYS